MDDLLPAYAKIIDDICPCDVNSFEKNFNANFSPYLRSKEHQKKTLDNHRTEIAGKLFGMYYVSNDGYVYESDRTRKFMADNDQPAFFKDMCYKMQFPNGMNKIQILQERMRNEIRIRPNAYVLKILNIARNVDIILTKKDIGYYILNSLDVLQGKANPVEVVEQIKKDKKENIAREVHTPDKKTSYDNQHINEQLNYLELANLIIINDEHEVYLNERESDAIEIFTNDWDKSPAFDVYSYDLGSVESRKNFQYEWDYYFSLVSDIADEFKTTTAALGIAEETKPKKIKGVNFTELGDEGEAYVLKYEKGRVMEYDPRLVGKVVHLGKTRGLGYDIQSVIAEIGDMAEFVKYIEVKSTKRVTEPDISDELWIDTLDITRNEWVAAQQHKDFYWIFRVYFVRGKVIMYIIKDLCNKEKAGIVKIVPTTYRVDFSNNSIDEVVN
jgi:hypothetical protein